MERGESGQHVHDVADGRRAEDEHLHLRILASRSRGVVVLRVAHDRHPPPVGADDVAFGHGLRRVVRALAVDVGPEREQQPSHVVLGEDDHVVHAPERGHEKGAIRRRLDGPALALEPAHGLVGVDPHHQDVRLGAGPLQVANVADVENVEAPVGEGDGLPRPARLGDALLHFLQRADLRGGLPQASPSTAARSSPGGHGGGGVLHHHDASCVVREAGGLRRPGARGQGEGEGRDHGVARARHVRHLVGAVDRDVQRRLSRLEQRHPVPAPRDQHRLRPQPTDEGAARRLEPRAVEADRDPERRFHLRLVRRDRGHAPEAEQVEARVHGDRHLPAPGESHRGPDHLGAQEAEPVVAHEHAVEGAAEGPQSPHERGSSLAARRQDGRPVHAHHLLSRGVDASGQDARLHRRRVAGCHDHVARRDPLRPQEAPQVASVGVAAEDSERQRHPAESPDVVDRVRPAPEADVGRVVLEDEHGRLAAHPLHAPVDELVGHEIRHHQHAPTAEGSHQLEKPRPHAGSPPATMRSTASRRCSATRSGGRDHRAAWCVHSPRP